MLDYIKKLEDLNTNKKPLTSTWLGDNSTLIYTSNNALLGKGNPFKQVGTINQVIDTKNLKVTNSEVDKYFGIFTMKQKVWGDIVPVSPSKVDVKFTNFQFGPVTFPWPKFLKAGDLAITYIDDNMRLCKGDKGGIFVIRRNGYGIVK
jgi:hypothetical protein